jgi:natural product biosynthesis luciferase-like monooxygenase protein
VNGFHLSPIQQGMLYHHLREPSSGVDIEQMIVSLHEGVDAAALRAAWSGLVNAHTAFRTSFRWDSLDQPQQIEHPATDLPWEQVDLSTLPPPEQEQRLDAYLRADRTRGFDLSTPPLTRAALFRRSAQEWVFVWTFHHISADGQVYPALIREGFDAYDTLRGNGRPQFSQPPAYRDFIGWLESHIAANKERAASYWREALRDFAAPTPLPGVVGGAADSGLAERSLSLSARATADLRAFASAHNIGMSTFIHAAWAILLSAHSNEEDVVFGETRAARRDTVPGADDIVGVLINTVPVRIRIDAEANVADWLKSIRLTQNTLRPFEHTPLAEIQRLSEVPANAPLFDSLVVFTPRLVRAAMHELGGSWARRDIRFIEQTNFPLTLFGYNENELLLKLAYDRARLTDAGAQRCLKQLRALLEALPQDAGRRVTDLPLVETEEREILATRWNATARDYDRAQTIHALFEAQAERTPDAVAVVFRDQSLTYRELNRRANQLAHRLRRYGAGRDRIVGIFMKRSVEMMIALLGTLKSGAAYLPLDPSFPAERLGWMLEDTRAPIVITQRDLEKALPHAAGARVLSLDGPEQAELRAEPSGNPANEIQPQDLAYVIFTSGSTGRPKGVMIEHRNVTNFFAGMDDSLQFREAGTWLAVTSISFDISVLELFWTLARGFKVVIQEEAWSAPERDRAPAATSRKMDFTLFYFSADASESPGNKYRLLLEGARFADQNGFTAVWTPERHFHAFGGLYPNPSLTSAAIATITSRVQLRAGSVVLPLHNPVRVAEEWSVVDNLSGGRVGLSFASGWHANDFALLPENYRARKDLTFQGIETIRRLWRGEAVKTRNGVGEEIDVRIFPAPLQPDPPIWVTAASSVETFRMAGEIGANLLTNLLGQKVEDLAGKIDAYRAARRAHGHAGNGIVSLMLHTFVGSTMEEVRGKVRQPFIDYLKTSTDLINQARWEFPAYASAAKQGPQSLDTDQLSAEDMAAVMDHAFERYFETSGLFGTPEVCLRMVDRLQAIGVDEVACLIDFGVDADSVLASLTYLNQVREHCSAPEDSAAYSIAAQLQRHQVTHLQCTPSLARVLAGDPESRAALSSLRKLMLGGEALPPSLAAELTGAIAGDLVNMYGPTETTVWSATAAIARGGGPITIGRPIANTELYVVDRHLRMLPIGAPGELLIGGEGVTRGYLNQPELTAERFVPDCYGDESDARLYRTGDLVRYREDGRIEFLGRIDNQAKVRGYRIEPGEIEATLAAHPAVKESVVIIHEASSGENQLIAYVTAGATNSEAAHWREIWDQTYSGAGAPAEKPADPALNTAGWISSYTGEPIPEEEMREWVERTVERITALKPKRVLEIGCGTGMLLLRIAPSCVHYHGVDFSQAALQYVQEQAERQGLKNFALQCATADELRGIEPGSVDLVIVNSVIQYFPSADYLAKVLENVTPLIAEGGAIFVGDVRSLSLLKAFHAGVELAQAPETLSTADLRRRVDRRGERDNELVLAPDFFRALQQHVPALTAADIFLKRGRYHNELTRFRYDVVLRIGGPGFDAGVQASERGSALTLDQLRDRLATAPAAIAFAGIPNPRVAKSVQVAECLASNECQATVAELRRRLGSTSGEGIDPEAIYALNLPYDVQLSWSADALDRYDAVFRHHGAAPAEIVARRGAARPHLPWSEYANTRAGRPASASLPAELKDLVKRRLPDYMVPSAIVVLDAMPRTPNGKLDRKALPRPDQAPSAAAASYTAPENELEKTIAGVWRDLLSLERVGSHDNFFDLGANSLIMMQANLRLRDLLKRNLRLVDLFQYPTVNTLAAHLGQAKDGGVVLEQSQQRGQARLDALRRRRVEVRK